MIEFNAIPMLNPRDPEAPKKFYARAVKRGEINLNTLAKEISQGTSLATADIHAALHSLLEIIPRYVTKGFYVKLGEFGTFYPMIKSVGMDTAETVNSNSVVRVRLLFRPGSQLAYEVGQSKLQKITQPKEEEKKKEEEKA